jgi:putative membrane protein
MVLAAPLLVAGRPQLAYLWALPDPWRGRVAGVVHHGAVRAVARAVTGPVVVLVVHGVIRWVWHLPFLWQLALEHEGVHAVQHFSFFASAALFWWALLEGRYGRAGYGVAVAFVFVTGVHAGVLGALITFARGLWYPLYAARGAAFDVDAAADQQLAGLIMWIPAGFLFLAAGVGFFVAWLGAASRAAQTTRLAALVATGDAAAR